MDVSSVNSCCGNQGYTESAGYGMESANSAENKQNSNASAEEQLTDEEMQQVQELKRRDQEVRAHEMAHISAGGAYVRGGASFEYQTGPDGKRYAVGGEVSIDTSAVSGDPEATIRKMQVVKQAALAPANPSGADRSVAAKASQTESRARQEQIKEKQGTDEGAEKPESGGITEKKTGYDRKAQAVKENRFPEIDIAA